MISADEAEKAGMPVLCSRYIFIIILHGKLFSILFRTLPLVELLTQGLVSKVFPPESLVDEAVKTATVIASYSLPAIMMVKEATNKCMFFIFWSVFVSVYLIIFILVLTFANHNRI